MKRLAPFAALAAAALLPQPAHARVLPPRDECAADASFARFRAELLDIIVRRDVDRLVAIVADDIEFSFGGDAGRQDFVAAWGLADPANSALWTELGGILLLGCARDGESMVAPYLFKHWPEELDPFTAGVAAPGTALYRAATTDSEIARLSWDILESVEPEGAGWARVRLSDGRSGYVEGRFVLSPIGYRAFFHRRQGQWRMTVFIAGD